MSAVLAQVLAALAVAPNTVFTLPSGQTSLGGFSFDVGPGTQQIIPDGSAPQATFSLPDGSYTLTVSRLAGDNATPVGPTITQAFTLSNGQIVQPSVTATGNAPASVTLSIVTPAAS